METVGIRDLKNRLAYYLSLTKKGEEVVVTERGRPIALLQPITQAQDATSWKRLARLAALSFVTLPTKPIPKSAQDHRGLRATSLHENLEERR